LTDGIPTHEGDGIAGTVRLPDGERLRVTVHCVDRFWERVSLGSVRFSDAQDRLRTLVATAGEWREPPTWLPVVHGRYLALGDDIGLIVRRDIAITCVARGGFMSDENRAKRNSYKRSKRYAKKFKRGR
jgi:hypothetical protein